MAGSWKKWLKNTTLKKGLMPISPFLFDRGEPGFLGGKLNFKLHRVLWKASGEA